MEKRLKYLLLGIVGFFGLSFTFAIDSNYQIVHDIGTDSFNSLVQYGGNSSSANFCLYKNLTSLPFSFSVVTGCKPSGGTSTFYITQFGNAGFRVISRVDSSNILFDSNYDTTLFTITGAIGGPVVYDSVNGGYLAFNRNTNSIILNGQEIWQVPSGSKSFSYGVGKSFSIMVLTGTQTGGYSDYFLNAYSDGLGNIVIDTGYMIIPIYNSQVSSSLSGIATLVVTSNSDGRIIYNIYDVFSSNPNILVNGNIIDKGFGPTSWNFGKVNFMTGTKFSSSNSFTNLLTIYPYYFIYGIDSFYSPVYSVNVNSFDSSNKIFPVYLFSDSGFVSDFSVGNILGGNGNQSTGSIAINTGFLDLCLNNLEFGDLNSYLCNQLLNGNNLVQIPNQTGYYLSYGVDSDGRIRFWITYQEDLEQQMSGYIWEQDGSGNWYTYLPDITNTGIDSSGLSDYFHNWFERGIFFSCPFHYTDSYYREFKLFGVMHYVPKLGDTFLYPIYCIGAGFREGKNIDFFSGVTLGLDSQLLSSPDYNYLYRLFDLVLSVFIMFFIIKIYHLLN